MLSAHRQSLDGTPPLWRGFHCPNKKATVSHRGSFLSFLFLEFADAGGATAVAEDVHPGKIAVALVGDGGEGIAELLGLAHPLLSRHGDQHSAVLFLEVPHVGGDQPGAERNDANALLTVLEGALFGVPDDEVLREGIGKALALIFAARQAALLDELFEEAIKKYGKEANE